MRALIRAAIALVALCAGAAVYAETRIRDIQGRAHSSPLLGASVQAVSGVVTALRPQGFFMQDPEPDEDPATSEGLFVLARAEFKVGDRVLVWGRVAEYLPGGPRPETHLTQTELVASKVKRAGSESALPSPVAIGTERAIPPRIPPVFLDGETPAFDPQASALDFYESMEGMRARVPDAVVVGPSNAAGEMVIVPINAATRSPRGALTIAPESFHPERIALDDALTVLPNARVGDRLGDVEGILTYALGRYVLHPTVMPLLRAGNLAPEIAREPRTEELSIAALNVENLDAHDPPSRFAQLAKQIVLHLKSPDMLGLTEVQDDNGPLDNGHVSADQTLHRLAEAVSALGGPRYQWRSVDPTDNADGGEPGANIRPVLLFNPARVQAVDRMAGSAATRGLIHGESVHLSRSPGRVVPWHPAFASSRKPLAAEFEYGGRSLFLVLNHFNSKRGDDPLFGRRQPPHRASESQRAEQASVVAGFARALLEADRNARIVVLGDFNDFEFAETLRPLKDAGLYNLSDGLPQLERYTYIHQGNAQALDHIYVSEALRAYSEYDIVHVNAEFPFDMRASDHDPVLLRLSLP